MLSKNYGKLTEFVKFAPIPIIIEVVKSVMSVTIVHFFCASSGLISSIPASLNFFAVCHS